MLSSKFRLIALATFLAFAAAPTVAAADDAEACGRQSGDRAIAACSRAIASDKYAGNDLATLHADRGYAWADKGDPDRAIADYDAAIRLDPKYALAYNHRGEAYIDKGDYARAIADLDEAIRLDPKYAHAYTNRGVVWGRKGDFGRAIADYTEAIRLDPDLHSPTSTALASTPKGRLRPRHCRLRRGDSTQSAICGRLH